MNRHEGQRSVVDDTSALTVEEDILLLQSALSANTGNEVCLSSPCAWRKQPSEDLMLVKHAFPTIHFLSHLFLNVSLDIGLEVNTQIFILCLNHLLATQCLLWALGGNDKRTSAGLSKGQREMAIKSYFNVQLWDWNLWSSTYYRLKDFFLPLYRPGSCWTEAWNLSEHIIISLTSLPKLFHSLLAKQKMKKMVSCSCLNLSHWQKHRRLTQMVGRQTMVERATDLVLMLLPNWFDWFLDFPN